MGLGLGLGLDLELDLGLGLGLGLGLHLSLAMTRPSHLDTTRFRTTPAPETTITLSQKPTHRLPSSKVRGDIDNHCEPLVCWAGVSGRFRVLAAGRRSRRDASILLFEHGAYSLSGGQTIVRVQDAPYAIF
ncbi:hypothetical protein DF183_13685 [Alcaligenes faecalis]|uniref:Uncharacterized protein n=1 Tax=Alcaligenes faecalis TaxID=511 RepID=A0A2U2BJK1_ALCFA|nr:hypothetical protein DF183_13685 [Alcaligenes faecalis]